MSTIKHIGNEYINIAGSFGMSERAADPSQVTATGFIFVKSGASASELFYMDSASSTTQLTDDGKLVVHEITWGDTTAVIASSGGGFDIQSPSSISLSGDNVYIYSDNKTASLNVLDTGFVRFSGTSFSIQASSSFEANIGSSAYIGDENDTYFALNAAGDIDIGAQGAIYINSSSAVNFKTGGVIRFYISNPGDVIFDDTTKLSTGNETAPDVDDGGLCLDQNAGDNNILTFKSSDVGHPFTTEDEADTYGAFKKHTNVYGGLYIKGYCEASGSYGLLLQGADPTPNTLSTESAVGVVTIRACASSGTGFKAMGSTENVFVIRNYDTTELFMKGGGRLYNNYATAMTLFDDEDDLSLLRAAQQTIGGVSPSDVEALNRLGELGIINEDGFGCLQDITRLQMGAVYQLFKAIKTIALKVGISNDELASIMLSTDN